MILKRTIHAPLDLVFRTVAHIDQFKLAIPHITEVVFLTEQTAGVGTRFRETRMMGKREACTELKVTEYVENEHVRLVADSHGTVWDTVFEVEFKGSSTHLTMTMESRSHKLIARVMNLFIGPLIKGAVGKDMDAVKRFCEGSTPVVPATEPSA